MDYDKLVKNIENKTKNKYVKLFELDDLFTNHVNLVRHFALKLSKHYKSDKQVIELAALLHDVSYTKENNHHNHEFQSCNIAERLLKGKISENKIKRILDCIKHHRGAKDYKRESIEEKIISSADAMAHIYNAFNFIYLGGVHKDKLEGVKNWLRKKTDRSWRKIHLSEGKRIIRKKYNALKTLLEDDENYFSPIK